MRITWAAPYHSHLLTFTTSSSSSSSSPNNNNNNNNYKHFLSSTRAPPPPTSPSPIATNLSLSSSSSPSLSFIINQQQQQQPKRAASSFSINNQQPKRASSSFTINGQQPNIPSLSFIINGQQPKRAPLGFIIHAQQPTIPPLSSGIRQQPKIPPLSFVLHDQQPKIPPLSSIVDRQQPRRERRVVVARVSEVSESSGGSTSSAEPRAKLVAKGSEEYIIEELQKPLAEYMTLPASQYSVLDAQRIERVDSNTFRCYVHSFKFFAIEVCPVLVVRVEEQPDGCCIRLLSCTLEGSPIVTAQNKKFSASMINRVSWSKSNRSQMARKLISDAIIEVSLEIPFAFRALPVELIESAGSQVLGQVLRIMLPRFLAQLAKDYYAWASGDTSRRPLGTGEI